MVDLKDLRENPDKYRRGAELKGVKVSIDEVLRLDEQHRTAQREFERYRAEQNEASKLIGKIKDASEKQGRSRASRNSRGK
ncbi:MAG: Serine--tRNA ligase [Phycisphaerales bacterium]|nr:Serine--tRNA ligase [Phycisphaerales bacterium]